jgi:hypothetical protein
MEQPMQRYFFHLNFLRRYIEDLEGTELPDLQAAKSEARVIIRHLAAEHLKRGEKFEMWSVRISDETNDPLTEVFTAEAINEFFPPEIFISSAPDRHI